MPYQSKTTEVPSHLSRTARLLITCQVKIPGSQPIAPATILAPVKPRYLRLGSPGCATAGWRHGAQPLFETWDMSFLLHSEPLGPVSGLLIGRQGGLLLHSRLPGLPQGSCPGLGQASLPTSWPRPSCSHPGMASCVFRAFLAVSLAEEGSKGRPAKPRVLLLGWTRVPSHMSGESCSRG